MTTSPDLADRYGAPAPWRRTAMRGLSVALAALFLGWLGWTMWDQSTPEAESSMVGYEVVDDHEVSAVVRVDLADEDVEATCLLRATADDHSVVGEHSFTPPGSGRSEQVFRTERRATSVELIGCTAPGQSRAR